MFRIDAPNNVATMPAMTPAGTPGYFQDSEPLGTVVSAEWCNAVQEEIAQAIEALGGTMDKANVGQLASVLSARVLCVRGSNNPISGVTTAHDHVAIAAYDATVVRGRAAVLGGGANTAGGYQSIVLGGQDNVAGADDSIVCAGKNNNAAGQRAIVAGGVGNTASGYAAAAVGGQYCAATGDGSVVLGGQDVTVARAWSVGGGNGALRWLLTGAGQVQAHRLGLVAQTIGVYDTAMTAAVATIRRVANTAHAHFTLTVSAGNYIVLIPNVRAISDASIPIIARGYVDEDTLHLYVDVLDDGWAGNEVEITVALLDRLTAIG